MTLQRTLILLLFLALGQTKATAHQRDMQNEDRVLSVRLGQESLDVRLLLAFKEFPSLQARMSMDTGRDGWISPEEAASYCLALQDTVLAVLRLETSSRTLALVPLADPVLDLYGSPRVVPLHQDLTIDLTSSLTLGRTAERVRLTFQDRLRSLSPGLYQFALAADRTVEVESTSLDRVSPQEMTAEMLRSLWFVCRRRTVAEIDSAASRGEDLWRVAAFAQAQYRPGDGTADLRAGSRASRTDREKNFRDGVRAYLESKAAGGTGFWLLLAAAFVYGCIHALAPGHAKTITAAYLVGSRHTPLHAVALALTVTLTHTGSVLALALITRLAYGASPGAEAESVLSALAGLIILVLGLHRMTRIAPTVHGQVHEHPHGPDHGRPESGKGRGMWGGILWLGFAGGLAPCPGALWVYFLALGFGEPGLGLALILALSAGLSVVLVAVGLATVWLRDFWGKALAEPRQPSERGLARLLKPALGRVALLLPGLAGFLLVLAGSFLLWEGLSGLGVFG